MSEICLENCLEILEIFIRKSRKICIKKIFRNIVMGGDSGVGSMATSIWLDPHL